MGGIGRDIVRIFHTIQRGNDRQEECVTHVSKGACAFVPYVLFGAFFMTLPILPPQLSLFSAAAKGLSVSLAPFVLGVAVAGILLTVRFLSGRRGAFFMSRLAVIAGSACYVVACAICVFAGSDDKGVGGAVLGALCGASMLFPAVAWGFLFARLSFRVALACVACALGLGGLFNFLFAVGLFEISVPSFIVMLCCGLVFPLVEAVRGDLVSTREVSQNSLLGAAEEGVVDKSEAFEVSIGYSLTTTLDLCIGLFLLVFVSSARFEAYNTGFMPSLFERIEMLSFMGGALCAAALLALRKRLEVSAVVNLYIPALAAVFFFLSQFSVESATFGVAFFLSHVLMAFIALMAFASLAAVSGKGEISPWVLHVCLYVGAALCSLFGQRLYVLAGADAIGPSLLLVASAYFVYVVLAALIRSRHLIERMAERERSGRNVGSVAACAYLAERYAFTAREREVLEYLAAGHGSPYIAEKLFISENTVRTHMRNMYRKAGVSSKEELIQILEAG